MDRRATKLSALLAGVVLLAGCSGAVTVPLTPQQMNERYAPMVQSIKDELTSRSSMYTWGEVPQAQAYRSEGNCRVSIYFLAEKNDQWTREHWIRWDDELLQRVNDIVTAYGFEARDSIGHVPSQLAAYLNTNAEGAELMVRLQTSITIRVNSPSYSCG
ncbi:hypothetical protein [Tessaracoccus sp. OH4464_COT-324]|uniref:hypothetical protein n=1 Tax=Tessaracoccus sp. OH4464_COT-324 TaxID=2491059 RepID=UPI000F6407D2|nr:hypothetical protein [Tessaracoccus sp. OH4464_COT-324]RRD46177.1 hypothetical protein EII42_08295 [Tessaracoccus sp. OH4464_COT-324]